MNALLLLFITSLGYLVAYHTYGRFLAQKIFKLNNNNLVPSRVLADGQDYVSAKKQVLFWSLPDLLTITLKRFGNSTNKFKCLVDFPLENLNLSEYVVGYNKFSYNYDLYGICNHSGGVFGGHYTAFVKNANNNWYLFNDQLVSQINDISKLCSPKAYCLFYRKKK